MSVARRLLVLSLLAGACSSRNAGDESKARELAKPPTSPTSPASPEPSADDRYDPGSLGATVFELSEGTPEARAHFTRGLLALHSFWYDEATRQFRAAITADATMNMAYWGAAMSQCKLLWGDDNIGAARAALSRMPDPQRLTPREQAWVQATIALLRAGDVRTSRKAFAQAMEAVHAQFPDDESTTFLALALLSSTRREDPDTAAVRERAAALAISVFEHNPKHPGAAHYLIHAYDMPALAKLGLPFAREYAKIAPAAFHARHMPAHIFSRLGMWKEAIASCQSAWDASVAAARQQRLSANHHDFHSLDWLIEIYFELGQRKPADAAMNVFAKAVRDGLSRQNRALYATKVASYMKRSGDWSRVDELLAPLEAPAVEDVDAPSTAVARVGEPKTHCAPAPASAPLALMEQMSVLDARVRAAAIQHDLALTKRLLSELDVVMEKLSPVLLASQPKEAIAKIIEVQARRRVTMIARASSDDRTLLRELRASVADANQESGGENNPSAFLLHEEIGDTLMRLKQPKDAAAEYALALAKQPGRARSLLGAARAAAQTGDAATARTSYAQLLELWSAAEDGTEGLAETRTALHGAQ